MPERTRAAVNEIIPGRLFQRSQIYTWQRDVKARYLRDWGITGVINFWPKTDAELGELELDWYWQLSSPRSEKMLGSHIDFAAAFVAEYIVEKSKRALVLCEAGKTRSVFFCVLVAHYYYQDKGLPEALALVKEKVPGMSLKGFMLDHINK